jgi:hypothetical protein
MPRKNIKWLIIAILAAIVIIVILASVSNRKTKINDFIIPVDEEQIHD